MTLPLVVDEDTGFNSKLLQGTDVLYCSRTIVWS